MTGGADRDTTAIVVRFNDSINGRDIDGLAALMTQDHRFVDTEGGIVAGRDGCVRAWKGFFAAFPDYRNVFTSLTAVADIVTVVGVLGVRDNRPGRAGALDGQDPRRSGRRVAGLPGHPRDSPCPVDSPGLAVPALVRLSEVVPGAGDHHEDRASFVRSFRRRR